MCGLFGWYLQRPDRRVVPLGAALSVLMDQRGTDSWGFYAYPHNVDKGTITKSPVYKRGLGTFAMDVPARSLRGFTMVLGHCRSASVGEVTEANAHPFHIGSVVGAHNGGIRNWQQLNKEHGRNFDVDSMHIFAHLDEQKPLSDLRGYGAITYVHQEEPQRIHLCRWNSGTLAVARVFHSNNKRAGIVWASTLSALAQGLGTAGFEWMPHELKESEGYFVEPDEDGIPDLFGFNYKYDFGKEFSYQHDSGKHSKSTDAEATKQKQFDAQGKWKWCATCCVVDLEQWHTNNKHTALAALPKYESDPTNGKVYDKDPNELLKTVARIDELKKKKEEKEPRMVIPLLPPPNPKPTILVAKSNGELVEEGDEEDISCAICYGPPGPPDMYRSHPALPKKAMLCITCYGEVSVAQEMGKGDPKLFQQVIDKLKRDMGYAKQEDKESPFYGLN